VSRSSTRIVPAYAKLNLSLSVVARRGDGWHDIDSVLVPVDWHDLVGLTMSPADLDSVTLTVSGPAAEGVPDGDANLTVRAARALQSLAGRPLAIRIWLCKAVPHGAGLGGGSADAAAVLRTGVEMLRPLGVDVDPARAARAALEVGSDVPALLVVRAQRVQGRGERLQPLATPSLHVAIASTVPSATADTYAALLPEELADDGRSARLASLLELGVRPDTHLMGSALEAAACRANPALAMALRRAREVLPARDWHLTGSGGAVFTVAADRHEAELLASEMRRAGFRARACRTIG
jgi:4-diphosphocytidyl-2-C-methyl-D-erythritol kinase